MRGSRFVLAEETNFQKRKIYAKMKSLYDR